MKHISTLLIIGFTCLGMLITPLAAKEKKELPQTTKDGLQLVHQDKLGAVYTKPGASLKAFDKIMLLDAYVAFAKNWKRDHNREEVGLGNLVSDKDMEKIKTEVASEFKKVFVKELQNGGYEVVTQTGQDVMLLRPAIINLTITAPDLNTAGMGQTFVRSAGTLTLYAELYDSVTSDKFAEVIDTQEAGNYGFGRAANRVSNKAALDQTLKHWADLLRKRLDEAHGKTGK